ncbi:hypothetical protein OG568_54805 (plasmid) [Streptomyces sp. NBC_01450]|uniref:hypothetical protein n=1 Tax=Streptomyces sp. NBC_01450 TaxID=2903871 RepID=UPI002E3275A8|nr:hypothetical protein [Streptomyces sp. NBC_01450]
MTGRAAFTAAVGLVAWWAGLALLWLVLIGPVDTLEVVVGLSCAAVGAVTARAAGRAVSRR